MFLILDCQAELEPINEQADDEIVHLDGFGEANSFSHQAFDPSAQREILALQLLGPPLADDMLVRGQVPAIGPPAVGVKTANPVGLEQGFEL
jgi:hypothetical protein